MSAQNICKDLLALGEVLQKIKILDEEGEIKNRRKIRKLQERQSVLLAKILGMDCCLVIREIFIWENHTTESKESFCYNSDTQLTLIYVVKVEGDKPVPGKIRTSLLGTCDCRQKTSANPLETEDLSSAEETLRIFTEVMGMSHEEIRRIYNNAP